MLNFSKFKITAITLICVFAVIFAAPSLISRDVNPDNKSALQNILPSQKVNLGLDLRGGSQLILKVDFDYYLKEQLGNLRNEIRDYFRDESIRSLPSLSGDKITFSIFNEEQQKLAKKGVRKISKNIEIDEDEGAFQIYFSSQEKASLKQNLIRQSIEIIRRRIDEDGTKEPVIQAQGDSRILLQVPGIKDSSELKALLGKTAKMTFHFVAGDSSSESNFNLDRVFDSEGHLYLIEREVVLSGDLLIDANTTYHEGQPAVAFRFNGLGSRKFAEITKNNIGRVFAIILDGKVVTAPRINAVINQGSGVISGSFTTKEANEVALLLRAGALPAPLEIMEERTVGPSLGLDSIESGKMAAIASIVLVAIFMLLFYGAFGAIANVAMVINISLLLSVLSFLGATLTLPGIAGIVLTMGISVDANILIFERIKEELRDKKSVFSALDQGFNQAFRTIIDSNITTLIVAFFLYAFGNGPIKGFAVTLSIGILSSMFSAIILTRMLIVIWLKKRKNQKLNLI